LKRAAAKGMINKIDQYMANIPGIQLYEPEKMKNQKVDTLEKL
jgi:carbon monoxide dehydrogenase subunit G